jgi:serine/threonine-protein kinase
MQQPLTIGTVLQNRYRLTKILGQEGMERTYLAEDEGRFNELCALKELIPSETGSLLESKELFQREATILYQIQHPQVPQFRATFEQERRLFLVQDYVEGKTYATVLHERQAIEQTFAEAEVWQLLEQLLPVLAYLHSRGIIHRDISPHHIILRDHDRLPVLIDFGVIKELANRFQSPPKYQLTTIGIGYAPIELQTGKAYPSSDLYALAVTSVVLLTGQEPQELFDDSQLLWNWQKWVTLSPKLSGVLDRMLSYKPSDRYQSVAEVTQALDLSTESNPAQPTAPESWRQTVVAGRRPAVVQSSTGLQEQPESVSVSKREIWDNPWAIATIGVLVVVLPGISSWLLVSSLLSSPRPPVQRQVPPQNFPSPLVSESPTPTTPAASDTTTPSTEPLKSSQSLNLEPGRRITVRGSLKANTTIDYTFHGEQGQQISAIANQGVLLSVLGLDQAPIEDNANQVNRYKGTLPSTGDYTIKLSPAQGVTSSRYRLTVRLSNSVQSTSTSSSH